MLDIDHLGEWLRKNIETPYFVDVLTCSAPFFSGLGYILPDGDLE